MTPGSAQIKKQQEEASKGQNNKNTVSYQAKFLKKIFSKLSHQQNPKLDSKTAITTQESNAK